MRLRLGVVVLGALLAAGCTAEPGAPAPSGPSRSDPTPGSSPSAVSSVSAAPSSSAAATPSEIPEPTTTNTLPPPSAPTAPAPSTAGDLDARALPVPPGWRTVAREGGEEEGYLGNGSWLHGRDPRYAAFDAITIGCAPITRDDYPDPTAALEGTYDRSGEPGIGLVLQFAGPAQARAYFEQYVRQVDACRGPDAPVQIERLPSSRGLIDRRAYDDGSWTEIAGRVDRRVTLVILSDPGRDVDAAQADEIIAAMR